MRNEETDPTQDETVATPHSGETETGRPDDAPTVSSGSAPTSAPQPTTDTTTPLPPQIGRYRVLGKLGEGGMGVVYEAQQENPRRRVAVKVVRGGQFVDDQQVRMFRREADTLARLKHPSIGAIYESGCTEDGQHFFVMELVQGETLDVYMNSRPTRVTQEEARFRLALFLKIAEAVNYAHQRGVIHRDLKPSNIVIGQHDATVGGSSLSGQSLPDLKILDFGLARITEGDVAAATMTTEVGVIKGTLPYMSPEQARGNPEDIDVRTDVYALGVILYEMLTGRRPYDVFKKSLVEAVRVICEETPRPLKHSWTGVRRLDPDVETIVGMALEKEVDRRYATAAALAADIERYLKSQPILARPPSALYQLRKFAQRNRALVGGVAATFLVLVIGIVVSTALGVLAIGKSREATRNSYVANIVAAESSLRLGESEQARRRLFMCPRELREWEWSYFYRQVDQSTMTLRRVGAWIHSVAFSPDGTRVATGSGFDQRVRLWNATTGELEAVLAGHESTVSSIAFSPDGKRIVSASHDGTVRLWDGTSPESDPTNRSLLTTILGAGDTPERSSLAILRGHEGAVNAVAFSPDGARIASGGDDASIRLWDATAEKMVALLRGHEQVVTSVAFSPDGTRLASGSWDHSVRLWDAVGGEPLGILGGHEETVFSVAFSPDGTRLVSGSFDKTLRVWDVSSGQQVASLIGHESAVESVSFSADGKRIASGSRDKTVRLWDAQSGQSVATLTGHSGRVNTIAFSPDSMQVASGSSDGITRFWDTVHVSSFPHDDTVNSVAFDPRRAQIASGADDGTVRLWDLKTGELKTAFEGHVDKVTSVAFSPGGEWIASGSVDESVRLWDVASGRPMLELTGHDERVLSVAVSSDGSRIATASLDKTVRTWDSSSGAALLTLSGSDWPALFVTFSPDCRWLASGHGDQVVRLWDVDSGDLLATLEGHEHEISAIAFSPDGSRLATGSKDHTLRLWDVSKRRSLATLKGHEDEITSIDFSPDGRRIASASLDRSLRLWDASSGELMATLVGHDGAVYSVAFSPDGTRLASGAQDKTVRLW